MNESQPLSFHVPEPEIRPGDSPDFSGVEIPKAGAARRPPIDAVATWRSQLFGCYLAKETQLATGQICSAKMSC